MRVALRCAWLVGAATVLTGLCGAGEAAEPRRDRVVYVDDDAPAGGDGSSWATACALLQDALDLAAAPGSGVVEVRVAAGVYVPDRGEGQLTGDRAATFAIPSGLALRGGFAGLGQPDPDARDLSRFPSILSGDLAGDDGRAGGGIGENSFHVVTFAGADRTAVLDGFVVRAGNASGAPPHDRGAGITVMAGAPTVSDVVLADNVAFAGAGTFASAGGPSFVRVVFREGAATFGAGAFLAGAAARFDDCLFACGTAVSGGGLYAQSSTPTLTACRFDANAASFDGGGAYLFGGAPLLDRCTTRGNTAGFAGGGVAIAGDAVLLGCKLVDDSAETGGGAYVALGVPMLADCTFERGAAGSGGGVHVAAGAPQISRATFRGCAAARGGGAATAGGSARFSDSTFTANTADDGGAAACTGGATAFVRCRVTENLAMRRGGGLDANAAVVSVEAGTFAQNVVDGGFVSSGGAISAAAASAVTIAGAQISANAARFGGAICSSQSSLALIDCTIAANTALIGGAVDATGGSVSVAGSLIEGNVAADSATADGGGLALVDVAATFEGCMIRGNSAGIDGGGIALDGGSAVVRRCTVHGNGAGGSGGALAARNATLEVALSVIDRNEAIVGGGIDALLTDLTVLNVLFDRNIARGNELNGECTTPGAGGAIRVLLGSTAIAGSTFSGNVAACAGAGGGTWGVFGSIESTILWGNVDAGGQDESAQVHGGAPLVRASCVQGLTGGLGGEGNIGDDPLLADAATGDLRLRPSSPCIDAGDNAALPPWIDVDLDGTPRYVDDRARPDRGFGEPPITDMGAYERSPGASCPADLDGSGDVGFADLLAVLASWGACAGCAADLDRSGDVGFADLLALLARWGPCAE